MEVSFTNFRGFQDSGRLEVRPITLLVGENSTGKTSFLAGLRYLLQAFGRASSAPFNREPYFLGGFSEIAHFRGGRGGRAKHFSLSISKTIQLPRSSGKRDITIDHLFSFGRGAPQPRIQAYSFGARGGKLNFSFDDIEPRLNVSSFTRERPEERISLEGVPPSELIRSQNGYISYLLDDVFFRAGRGVREKPLSNAISLLSYFDLPPSDLDYLAHRPDNYGLAEQVFASAPVRTQPSRTYTPSEIALSSEGSHVPLELARIKASGASQWQNVKDKLVAFGQSAHLFSDVDVKQFGKGEIDPFQLTFKNNGPAMNVVDVGYGISQILPIIYQIQNPGRYSVFLLQQPEVHLHPRAQAELGSLITRSLGTDSERVFVIETHSDYLIDRIRIEILEGRISPAYVTILYFKRLQAGVEVQNVFLDESGNLTNPPDDFRSFFLREHMRLIGV